MRKNALPMAVALMVITAFPGISAKAQSSNQVGLVVQYGDGEVVTRCIEFTEPQISGLEVLLRSGLDLVYSVGGMGTTVCKIGEEGCDDPARCFCRCKGDKCEYWSYWHLIDGEWQYSGVGAGGYAVRPGAVEGWVWGAGTISNAPRPPDVSFQDICSTRATPTSAATSTPSPTLTAPASPTVIQVSSPTPTTTAIALSTASPTPPLTPANTPRTRSLPAPTTAAPKGYPLAGVVSFFLLLIILGTVGAVVHRRLLRR